MTPKNCKECGDVFEADAYDIILICDECAVALDKEYEQDRVEDERGDFR